MRTIGYGHPDAAALVAALFEDQLSRYGYADSVEANPAAYRPPARMFLVAYLHGLPVAYGGYRTHRSHPTGRVALRTEAEETENRTAEIKKMYTLPEHRGYGYGWLLLVGLERHAADAEHAILETGVRNRFALALHTSAGYEPAPSYVPWRDPAINRAFTKPQATADPAPPRAQ